MSKRIINKEYKFCLEIPDEYIRLSKKEMEESNLAEGTVEVFLCEGLISKVISINRDIDISEENTAELLFNLNKTNLIKFGATIVSEERIINKKNKLFFKLIMMVKKTMYASYFTVVNNVFICMSGDVTTFEDISLIVDSMEDI